MIIYVKLKLKLLKNTILIYFLEIDYYYNETHYVESLRNINIIKYFSLLILTLTIYILFFNKKSYRSSATTLMRLIS